MGAIVQKYWDDHLTYYYSLRSIFVEQSIALILLFFFCPGRRPQRQFQFGFIAVKLEIFNRIEFDSF